MSAFSDISHRFRSSLDSAGHKLRLGHAHQILSAGLGHNSLASLKVHDQEALEQAESVVADTEAMLDRAKSLGHDLSIEAVHDALRQCRFESRGAQHALTSLGNMPLLVMAVGMDFPHPEKEAIANRLSGLPNDTRLLDMSPVQPIGTSQNDWRWRTTGELIVIGDELEYRVPIACDVVFPKLGRHLLGKGYIENLVQSGEPTPQEPDFITEFDPHAGSH